MFSQPQEPASHASAKATIQPAPGAPQHPDPTSSDSLTFAVSQQPAGFLTKPSPYLCVLAQDRLLPLRRAGNAPRGPSPAPSGSPDRALPELLDLIVRALLELRA